MGYGTRDGGWWKDSIRTFTPDDTDTEIWVKANFTSIPLSNILALCAEKWPTHENTLGFEVDNISISAEYIHTDCLGYDRYDAGDYTRFLKITKEK